MSAGDVAMALGRRIRQIGHIQVAGVPDRGEPNDGELNFPFLFTKLECLGYKGYVGCDYDPRGRSTTDGLGWFLSLFLSRPSVRMSIVLGCIADDYTGASDLANTLTKAGLRTVRPLAFPRAISCCPTWMRWLWRSRAARSRLERLWRSPVPPPVGSGQRRRHLLFKIAPRSIPPMPAISAR